MRIVGGALGGRRLAALGKGDPRAHLRPTPDRVREALFNMLEGGRFGDPIDGVGVLDLFAGSGALGLEALSRGAGRAVFVDNGRAAQRLLRRNIEALGLSDRARVLTQSALSLPEAPARSKLVFLDPPYDKALGARALLAARRAGWIAPHALVVWEAASAQAAPEGFVLCETRAWGDTHVTILEAGLDPPAPGR